MPRDLVECIVGGIDDGRHVEFKILYYTSTYIRKKGLFAFAIPILLDPNYHIESFFASISISIIGKTLFHPITLVCNFLVLVPEAAGLIFQLQYLRTELFAQPPVCLLTGALSNFSRTSSISI